MHNNMTHRPSGPLRLILTATVLGLALVGCEAVVPGATHVGKPVPLVENGTPASGETLAKYCTSYNPDMSLHDHTIPELVASKTPFILIFGTPAHCTQCQNQLDTVKAYQVKYKSEFEVVHIDQYKNDEVYTKMNVKGDPWTFMVNAEGIVTAVYPGVTTWDNLDGDIKNMMGHSYNGNGGSLAGRSGRA